MGKYVVLMDIEINIGDEYSRSVSNIFCDIVEADSDTEANKKAKDLVGDGESYHGVCGGKLDHVHCRKVE